MKNRQKLILLNGLCRVGIIGVPPLKVIHHFNKHQVTILDLDEPLVVADIESATPYLPRVYCAILRTAVVNLLHLELDAVYIDVGPGKCDCALNTAAIIQDILKIPVIRTCNQDKKSFGFPLCTSNLPLTGKLAAITKGVKSASPAAITAPPCTPTAGFWGVPPRDFSILSLFPETTHVYGWSRCMENKTPADTILETHYNPTIPTIFFAQSFCAKTSLARFLAKKHPHALYLDIDLHASSSAKAKIQAFLELSTNRNQKFG